MTPFSVTARTGLIVTSQRDVVFMPRNGPRGKRAVLLMHGQLQQATDWNDAASPGQAALATAIAAVGLVCIALYAEGPGWGNDTVIADMETARTYAGTLGCASDKVLLVGASMGALDAFNYVRAHPDRVAALVGVIPASDLADIRTNNRGGNTTSNINTAWALAGGDPLPARSNPTDSANAAAILSAGAVIALYYSTADTVVIPATVTTLAAEIGATATVIDTTNGHSDTTIGLAPQGTIASLLAAAA